MYGKRRASLSPDSVHLSAATIMSASPSIEAYDAQMLDFSSDPDVPMHITGSAEFFAEALMDHDGQLSVSTYGEHASVEVDMEEYVGDDAEYEMADETAEYPRSHGDELLDIEVYDASHAPSPLPAPEPLQPSVDVPIDSEHPTSSAPAFSEHATLPELLDEPGSEVHPAPLDHPAADVPHVELLASEENASSEAVPLEPLHPTAVPAESTLPVSESHEQLGETAPVNERPFETLAPADAADEAEHYVSVHPVAEEPPANSGEAQHETHEPPTAEPAPLATTEEIYDNGPMIRDKRAADQAPATEGEAVDPLRISDGVYIDPPPAVLLSIADLAQPEFVLFNQPVEGESTGEPHSNREAYSLLLENRPTLYYESLSSVFEALRQDEALLSRVPHSFEGELFLDAYDLQLAVSEDNVHSREITLHDLNILHDGSNFVGPLRLFLRANVPRFIIRYYALQERIQRLNVAADTGEGEHDEEHHEEYDTGEEQNLPREEEVTDHSATHTSIVSEGPEVAPTAELEEPVKELAESTEEASEGNPQDTSGTQEPVAEYREVTEEATHTLPDEHDYEGTNADDEDESAKSDSLDADQVHDTAAEDTDAAATVAGHGSELGGEQSEYLDYVQPEEYDDRYGEDLPERAGGASSVQYGEPPNHEEGEQDTSTAVDETQVILPGSDEYEEDKSVVTPVPTRAVLEPESSELTGKVTDTAKQNDSHSSGEELATSESTQQIVEIEQTLGNHEPETTREKIFSQVDESDSNFVSLLEREADAEFDRTFNAEQNGQETSVEATLQQESTWDEWDDEDAEGEDEEDWIDPDAVSNESSVTLSSKASSKRSYDEVDPSEAVYMEDPNTSPGSKRPRVQ